MPIKILDCTVRDGGYINNWSFNNNQILDVITSLEESRVDIIECGYLDSKKGKAAHSTLFDNVHTIDKLLEQVNSRAQKVVMINLGDFNLSSLPHKNETKIDGIRLAFHKKDINQAIESSAIISQLGYKLFFQPMVTKNYSDDEFLDLLTRASSLDIYSFYIVDSFGSMTLKVLKSYMELAHNNLNKDVYLGYHSHNNMQLAFSNAIHMCSEQKDRKIIIDSSIYGIGRGAGNLNTELILDYLNKNSQRSYKIPPLLDIIDEILNPLMKESPWGFSPAQYLSASFDCHPNYATYLINKNTNQIAGIRKILESIPKENKVSFNRELIEKLYLKHMLHDYTSPKGTFRFSENQNVLLVASGETVKKQLNLIKSEITKNNYTTVALNHIPSFECNYYFFTNQKRFNAFGSHIDKEKLIITSNIQTTMKVDTVLEFKKLAFIDEALVTNVSMVIINHLIQENVKKLSIVGLDGYEIGKNNYSYNETRLINDHRELLKQNEIISDSLKRLNQHIEIMFLTPSMFKISSRPSLDQHQL